MIGREVRQHADFGCEVWAVVQLKRRDLETQPLVALVRHREVGHRPADVPCRRRLQARGAQQMGHQRGRRRLAVGSRDRDAARAGLERRQRAEAEIELRDDLDTGVPRGGQHQRIGRHTRRYDHAGRVADLVQIVPSDLDIHPGHALECFGRFAGVGMSGRVAGVDPHPFARQ